MFEPCKIYLNFEIILYTQIIVTKLWNIVIICAGVQSDCQACEGSLRNTKCYFAQQVGRGVLLFVLTCYKFSETAFVLSRKGWQLYLIGGRFKSHYYTEVQFVYNTEYSLGVLNTKVEFFWVCRASRKCNTGASCDVNLSDASLTCLNTDRCELLLRCISTLRSGRAIHMRIAARNAFEARLH